MAQQEETASNIAVGTVDALWRFPVKSMLGEDIDEAELTERGVVGDSVHALIDSETGHGRAPRA
jgi:uncharacterized protein YcbX